MPVNPTPSPALGPDDRLGAPPLGPLDGRYRAVVAPLVEHLSEPALNRDRVHVEVEWLIHLTSQGAVPGARRLDRRRGGAAARRRRRLRPGTTSPSWPRSSGSPCTTSRPSSTTSSGACMAGTSWPTVAELVHFCCTSEDVNNLAYALMVRGAVQRGLAAGRAALADERRRPRRELPRAAACWRTRTASRPRRPRSARSSPSSPTGCAASCAGSAAAEYLGKINGATGTFGAHVAAVPGTDWVAVSRTLRRGPRADLEPADHPDRVPRLAGRALRRRRALQPGAAQPVHRRVDLHLAGLLRAGARPGHRRVQSTMPHKVNPIRFENAEANLEVSQRAARRARLDPGHLPAAARPHRLVDAAQHRHGVRPLAARDRQRAARAGRARRRSGGHGSATSTPTGRCSARRCSRRCARPGSPACPAWTSPTSG